MKGGGQGLEALRSGVSDEKDAQLAAGLVNDFKG